MRRSQCHYKVRRYDLLCFQRELHRNAYATYLKLLPVVALNVSVRANHALPLHLFVMHCVSAPVSAGCTLRSLAVPSPPLVDIHKTHTRCSSHLYTSKI